MCRAANCLGGSGRFTARLPIAGREGNTPKSGRGRRKPNRDQISFVVFDGGAGDPAVHAFAGAIILHFNDGLGGERARAQEHGSVVVHGNRCGVGGHRFARDHDFQANRNSQDHPVTASSFLAGQTDAAQIATQSGFAHSSNPQKSSGGWVNSIPSSQPPSRRLPLQTTVPGRTCSLAMFTTVTC